MENRRYITINDVFSTVNAVKLKKDKKSREVKKWIQNMFPLGVDLGRYILQAGGPATTLHRFKKVVKVTTRIYESAD